MPILEIDIRFDQTERGLEVSNGQMRIHKIETPGQNAFRKGKLLIDFIRLRQHGDGLVVIANLVLHRTNVVQNSCKQ